MEFPVLGTQNGGYLCFVSKTNLFYIRASTWKPDRTKTYERAAVDLTFVYRRKSSLGWFGVPERSDLGDGYEVRVDEIVGNFTDVFRFY